MVFNTDFFKETFAFLLGWLDFAHSFEKAGKKLEDAKYCPISQKCFMLQLKNGNHKLGKINLLDTP